MRVIIVKDQKSMSEAAARFLAEEIKRKPDIVLGLPTGATPLGMYRELVTAHREGGLSFSSVRIFNLDEYYPISPRHPQSYNRYMWDNFFGRVDIAKENVHIPSGEVPARDIIKYCESYEKDIFACGGLDITILGIGRDGHIGFNEPGSSLSSKTRLKTLTQETISDNGRCFASLSEVPKFAITMGISTILSSRVIMLLASGRNKAEALAKAIEGPVTCEVPASSLQLHKEVVIIADEEAANALKRKKYHKFVEKMWLKDVWPGMLYK